MADPGTNFRRAYQAVLDRTPPPPEWDQLDASPTARRPRPARPRPLPRWLVAGAAAGLLLAVLGGAAMLGLDGGPPTTAAGTAPTGDAPPATAAPPATTPRVVAVDPPAELLPVARAEASSQLGNFEARYLVDGTERAWNDESLRGAGATMRFAFAAPVDVEEVVVHNLADPERFARNYRIATFRLLVDGAPLPEMTVPDQPGPHRFEVGRRAAAGVTLEVLGVHPAEAFGGAPPFEELAVAEVEFIGRVAG